MFTVLYVGPAVYYVFVNNFLTGNFKLVTLFNKNAVAVMDFVKALFTKILR